MVTGSDYISPRAAVGVAPGKSIGRICAGLLRTFFAYSQLLKLRIVVMVLATTSMGMLFAGGKLQSETAVLTLLGTALMAGGSCVLNQYFERCADGRMQRTCTRPLPAATIFHPAYALVFGVVLTFSGTVLLLKVNTVVVLLGVAALIIYIALYTPLKKLTWLCTPVGAIAGAIPPLIGWASVNQHLDTAAWLLFLALFFWQHLHFYAIAWIYKSDYQRGGFQMLSTIDSTGTSTWVQSVSSALALLLVTVWLGALPLSGSAFRWGAPISGAGLLLAALLFAREPSGKAARTVLIASIFYLPILLGLISWDH